MTPPARLRGWHPAPPPLPLHLREEFAADDPEWFARELAVAAAPPWWFGRLVLRTVPRLVGAFGRVAAPVVGPLLERAGVIRVVRGTDLAPSALQVATVALVSGDHVVALPGGPGGARHGRLAGTRPDGAGPDGAGRRRPGDPGEPVGGARGPAVRPRRGRAAHRTAGAVAPTGAPGAHRAAGVLRGPPPRSGRHANRARTRIAAALTRGLEPLRTGEPRERIAFADPTRAATAVAAFPGGVVPGDIP